MKDSLKLNCSEGSIIVSRLLDCEFPVYIQIKKENPTEVNLTSYFSRDKDSDVTDI